MVPNPDIFACLLVVYNKTEKWTLPFISIYVKKLKIKNKNNQSLTCGQGCDDRHVVCACVFF